MAWAGDAGDAAESVGRLRRVCGVRVSAGVQPADLDGALQVSAVLASAGRSSGSVAMPFAVNEALMRTGSAGVQWATASRLTADSSFVGLGGCDDRSTALLDGFKMRSVRAVGVAKQKDLYSTQWVEQASSSEPSVSGQLLMLGVMEAHAQVTSGDLVNATAAYSAVALKLASCGLGALALTEAALELLRAQASSSKPPAVWLVTAGAQLLRAADVARSTMAGVWGLARAVRAETQLPVRCVDADVASLLLEAGPAAEPEVALRAGKCYVSRLQEATVPSAGNVSLQFHSRGALGNLFIEPMASVPPAPFEGDEATIRVRAVGLNFRDVLNVLGEYPGDPGPPGGDCGGIIVEADRSALHAVGGCTIGRQGSALY